VGSALGFRLGVLDLLLVPAVRVGDTDERKKTHEIIFDLLRKNCVHIIN
jgi:hypothetical protein